MMRRGESFYSTNGGGRFWLELVRTCPCLSVFIRHAIFVKLTQLKKNRDKTEIKNTKSSREKEKEGERNELEELEGRLSYIGRRSRVCITRE